MKNEQKVNLLEALKDVVDAKNMDNAVVLGALKQALVSAAKKYLHVDKKIDVEIDEDEVHVFLRVKVVDDYPDYDPNMTAEEVIYVGDDIPDYEIMQQSGCPCCPADACTDIKAIARYVSDRNGGEGCGRDIIEQVLRAQGKWLSDERAFGW